MTVISTLITRAGTVHVTDSLITRLNRLGEREPTEWQETKIIPVRAWRGAMSYYGLAQIEGLWSTLDWLRDQAGKANAFRTPMDFAQALAKSLDQAVASLPIRREIDKGIGIHFSTYESIDGYWIPDLIHISNWSDPSYTALRSTGVGASADLSGAVSKQNPELKGDVTAVRLKVHRNIHDGMWPIYNNGDPLLFNKAATTIFDMFKDISDRGILRDPDNIDTIRALARRAVEIVSNIQHDLCRHGTRVVGGRIHDLSIKPNGDYYSTSGDIA